MVSQKFSDANPPKGDATRKQALAGPWDNKTVCCLARHLFARQWGSAGHAQALLILAHAMLPTPPVPVLNKMFPSKVGTDHPPPKGWNKQLPAAFARTGTMKECNFLIRLAKCDAATLNRLDAILGWFYECSESDVQELCRTLTAGWETMPSSSGTWLLVPSRQGISGFRGQVRQAELYDFVAKSKAVTTTEMPWWIEC